MRVVALISGGKDSCYSMLQCIAAGHQIVALANIKPKSETEINSYMYQSVGFEAIELIAKAMELPLFVVETEGRSKQQGIEYVPTEEDEVEDLFQLLKIVKEQVDEVQAVCCGAILSDYQRIRVENVCIRLGLVSLAYLWHCNQQDLLKEMIKCEIDAVVIKVAALGLEPQRHLGRSIRLLEPHLHAMHEKYGLNVCGEGGEYETLTLDCPLYSSRLVIEQSEVVSESDDQIASVGYLKLNKLRLEQKLPQLDLAGRLAALPMKDSDGYITDIGEDALDLETEEEDEGTNASPMDLKLIEANQAENASKTADGWLWVGGITGKSEDLTEACSRVMNDLKSILESHNHKLQDLCSISMYVSDMSRYAEINRIYCDTLNHFNPPTRACVQVPLPNHCPIILEAVSWSPPGSSSGDSAVDRKTMHVQSISHWCPANIGPYSQAVKVGDMIYLAGQIALVPGRMDIVRGGVRSQCQLSLRHVKRLLKGIDASCDLRNVVQGICFLTDDKHIDSARKIWEEKTNNAIVDYVVVSGLPRNALVEWHVWAHRHNLQFEYEETGQCFRDWSVSIFRRSNYENNIAAIVCHVNNEADTMLTPATFRETIDYVLRKLNQGHEHDASSLCNFKIFHPIGKKVCSYSFVSILEEYGRDVPLVYTVVPVLALSSRTTFLSICGVRTQ